jgi:queuosine precursor transporter
LASKGTFIGHLAATIVNNACLIALNKQTIPFMRDFFGSRPRILWMILSGFFVTNALVAEFMGVKLFSLEKTFGYNEVGWSFLGQTNLNFTLSAGILLWPMVFIMTDVINEYYGKRGVRMLSWLTAGLIAYSFLMLTFAMLLEPADFWRTSHIGANLTPEQKQATMSQVGDYNAAFQLVFGQSQWIIVGSLIAFLISQLVDVRIFHWIKGKTGEDRIWLRSTGSTLVSQLIDTFVVGIIALHLGMGIPLAQVVASCLMGYMYKGTVAFLFTPIIYALHAAIERYLGHDVAREMKLSAAGKV